MKKYNPNDDTFASNTNWSTTDLIGRTHIGRIKVIKDDEDIMNCICICPHCGNHVLYGNMLMYSGVHSCPFCHESIRYSQ